jgi:RNA 2',3'-cyclic 3'-phosphodiesterase
MSRQLSLPGFDSAPQRATDGLFFALFPDANAAARIAVLARRLRGDYGLRGAPLRTDRFHVTLHHLGNYAGLPQGVVAMASQAAAAVAMPPFNIGFNRVASFSSAPRNRPLVLLGHDGVAAVTVFQQALGMTMKKAGLGRWAKLGYTPHLTLLYEDRCIAEHVVETIAWTAQTLILVHSLLGQTRHEALARWPMHG